MFRVNIQSGYIVAIESMFHLTQEQIEERKQLYKELFLPKEEIEGKQLPLKPVYDAEGNLIGAEELPKIEYTIDKTQITTDEVATITIIKPTIVTAVINEQEYLIEDGTIEFSHFKQGNYEIMLKADGFKPTIIQVEVV
ncbi:hypothetical protein [Caloranaerobacter sp. DY30410]|uniref:hypothetical protein n=1 Tax=Caloranaerobacter sp. DY30410 TaxID=3238305 RepID=UPI003D029EB3